MEKPAMDALAWLRLQVEWGADEALEERPLDRRAALSAAVMAPTALVAPVAIVPVAPVGSVVARARALAAAASSPQALQAALAGFDGCALRTTATNLVFSDGSGQSGLVLVADVPGAAEDRAGLPFAGAAAAFLDRMFASAGLHRAAALSTSLLPWRPPGGRPPTEAEVQTCLPFLQRHLALLQPRFVLLVGGLAARTLLPAAPKRGRGGWQTLEVAGLETPVPTLALPSLAHIQATPAAKRDAWADLLRLRGAMIS